MGLLDWNADIVYGLAKRTILNDMIPPPGPVLSTSRLNSMDFMGQQNEETQEIARTGGALPVLALVAALGMVSGCPSSDPEDGAAIRSDVRSARDAGRDDRELRADGGNDRIHDPDVVEILDIAGARDVSSGPDLVTAPDILTVTDTLSRDDHFACPPVGPESGDICCGDGRDNDGDGYVDCEDWDCGRNPAVTVCAAWQGTARPQTIDGLFDDWETVPLVYRDILGDADPQAIDFGRLRGANDDRYLFLQFDVGVETSLSVGNNLAFYLDTDDNPATGYAIAGLGAELAFTFGSRSGWFNGPGGSIAITQRDIGLMAAPAVTSSRFEIAIGRDAMPDGTHPLFSGPVVRLALADGTTGDRLPATGQVAHYFFDSQTVADPVPVSLERSGPDAVRTVSMNTLGNGMLDPVREAAYERIFDALAPDLFCFQESGWGEEVRTRVTDWLGGTWHLHQQGSNVALSRFPIVGGWPASRGLLSDQIDVFMVEIGDRRLVVFNAHLTCCSAGDGARQAEADSFIAFLRDARSPGGALDLGPTPFVLVGDLNLVGSASVRATMREGAIIDQETYGAPHSPDWDGTALLDVRPRLSDRRLSYTWSDSASSFWPSRIDYALLSDSVIDVAVSFVLDTAEMSTARLVQYGLLLDDSIVASDHRPVVVDLGWR